MKFKMFFTVLCLIVCAFAITGACAGDANETFMASEGHSDDLIEIESQDEVLQSMSNESGTTGDVLANENEDSGNTSPETPFNETGIDDDLGAADDDCLKDNITIDTSNITVNSTKRFAVEFSSLEDVDIDDFNFNAYCTEGNVTKTIGIINREIAGQIIMLELEHANFTSATLDIRYKADEFSVTLNRKYNVKVESINNVVEYQSGKLIYRFTDIDLNEPLANRNVSMQYKMTGGSINYGVPGGITILSTETNMTDENGVLVFDNNLLDAKGWGHMEVGNHTVTFKSDDFAKVENASQDIVINKATVSIGIDDYREYYDSDKKYNITVTNAGTGDPVKHTIVHIYLPFSAQMDYYLQTDENGTCQLGFNGFSAGTYGLTISNNDTKNIENISVNASATILPEPMNVSAVNVSYGYPLIIEVELAQRFSGIATIDDDEWGYGGYVTNGSGKITLFDLDAGIYNVTVSFSNGNMTTSKPITFEIYKANQSLWVEYGPTDVSGIITIYIIEPDYISGNITLGMNCENFTSEIEDGVARFKITGLEVGEYDIDVYYSGDNNHFASSFKDRIEITLVDIDDADIMVQLSDTGSGTITLPGDAKGTVTVDVAGKRYVFDVVNGVAKVNMPDLVNGNHRYVITYSGDAQYASFEKAGSLSIKKNTAPTKPQVKTTLTLKAVKVKKSAKKLVLQATLKQDGKAYKAKTNKNGIAKVTIKKAVLKKLKVGKKVSYQASYGKTTVKKSTKVKR